MNRVTQLETVVRRLYGAKDPNRAEWADWLYENHVIWVADKATELAQKKHANFEYARAAALLHDIEERRVRRRRTSFNRR